MTLFQAELSLSIAPVATSTPFQLKTQGPGTGRNHTARLERRGSDLPQPNPRAGKMVSKDRFLSGILPGRGSMGLESQFIREDCSSRVIVC